MAIIEKLVTDWATVLLWVWLIMLVREHLNGSAGWFCRVGLGAWLVWHFDLWRDLGLYTLLLPIAATLLLALWHAHQDVEFWELHFAKEPAARDVLAKEWGWKHDNGLLDHLPGFSELAVMSTLLLLAQKLWLDLPWGWIVNAVVVGGMGFAIGPALDTVEGWMAKNDRNKKLYRALWFSPGHKTGVKKYWGNTPEAIVDQFLRLGHAGTWGGYIHYPARMLDMPGAYLKATMALQRKYRFLVAKGVGVLLVLAALAWFEFISWWFPAAVLFWINCACRAIGDATALIDYTQKYVPSGMLAMAGEATTAELRAGGLL